MVLVPKIENARESGWRMGEEEADFLCDLRLARRWKRRCIAYENGGLNSCINKGLKKTVGQNNKNNDAFVEARAVDSDYVNLLHDMEGFLDFDVGCVNYVATADSDDNVREVFDPDYMMFLDNLKEDGKSYVLELALGEMFAVVKYEKEDDLNNELDVENSETSKHHSEQSKAGTENALKSCLRRERIEFPRRVLRSNSSKQVTKSLRMNCRSNADAEKTENKQKVLFSNPWKRKTENISKTLRSESKMKNNENPRILHDVVERVKMEIPRTLRSNSRREANSSSRILQDAEIARTSGVSMGTQTNLRESVVEKNVDKETEDPILSASRRQDLVDESYGEFLKLLRDGQHLEYSPDGGKKVIYEESDSEKATEDHSIPSRRHSPQVTKHQCNPGVNSDLVDEDYLEFLKSFRDSERWNCTFDGGKKVMYEESDSEKVAKNHSLPSRRLSPEVTNSTKQHCNPGVNSELVDEDYLEFLKSFRDGEHLECTLDGKKVIHEENDYDSEVTILEDNPFSEGKHIPIVDVDGEECVETPGPEFRRELMEILQKPYDRMEYEKLWKEASLRKPLEGYRVLRYQTISYKLDASAKSYLERNEYSDLASVVDQARGDQYRILNLLRGFFYWLQNLAHKGAFKPWLDSSCLSILPPIEPGSFASGSDHDTKCAFRKIQISDSKLQDLASL